MIRRQVAEESILFFSILKWFFLAMVSGASVGLVVGCFMLALDAAIGSVQVIPNYYYLLPLALVCTSRFPAGGSLADGYQPTGITSNHKNVLVHPFPSSRRFSFRSLPSPVVARPDGGPWCRHRGRIECGTLEILRLDPADRRKLRYA